MEPHLLEECAAEIAKRNYKIAFVESATAGRMCAEFAMTSHSGSIIRGGLVCYSVFVKEQFLKVPHKLIEVQTPESQEVTDLLAKNGAKLFNSDITVAVTGLTTVGGSETASKPVGTMFLSINIHAELISHRGVFKGTPQEIIHQTINKAAELILKHLARTDL